MRHSRIASACAGALLLAGCVKSPDAVTAQYVSHVPYQSLGCDQIAEEQARISAKLAEVSALQQENANTDIALVAVGMLVFWPALLAMPATTDRKEEIGRLKGEYEALERLAIRTGCTLPARDRGTETAQAPSKDVATAAE